MKRILTVLALALVMLALPMSAVYALQPTAVSGTQIVLPPSPDSVCERRGNSDNFVCIQYLTEIWHGDIEGVTEEFESRWNIHDMVPLPVEPGVMCLSPPMEGMCWGVYEDDLSHITWETSLDIKTFNKAFVKVGDDTYEVSGLTIQLSMQHRKGGNWVIKSGTIDLNGKTMNIHGSGTLNLTGTPFQNIYSGEVHIGP